MLDEILAQAVAKQASDIFLIAGLPVSYKCSGVIRREDAPPLKPADTAQLAAQLYERAGRTEEALLNTGDDDFSFAVPHLSRFRVNALRQRGSLGLVIRVVPFTLPDFRQCHIPDSVMAFAQFTRGLVLITGAAGSGKSTTLAAMIDHINKTRSDHIITIEDPIEYVYQGRCSLIHQREVGADVRSFASALRSALREDPDVILVGEMRDYETISAAVTAAETGHLVMSTLHTIGAAQTIDRIIDVCPAGAQNQIRGQLAAVLRGVITQQLLPLAVGKGRCAATEILVGTDAVANLIREGKCYQIPSILQSGAALGMHSLNADLARLVSTGRITREAAERCATNKSDLKNYL